MSYINPGNLLSSNNLSDLAAAATARTNLGVDNVGANPTPAATVNIAMTTKPIQVHFWTAGQAETVNITGTQAQGQIIILVITNDGTQRVITWGTGILPVSATLTGTINKTSVTAFVSNGTSMYEIARALGM